MSAGAAKEDFISSKLLIFFISLLHSWINVEAFIVISKAGPIPIISNRLTFEIQYQSLLIFIFLIQSNSSFDLRN